MTHWRRNNQNPDCWPHGKNRERLWWLVIFLADKVGGMGVPWSQEACHWSFPEPVSPASNMARLVRNAIYLKQTGRVKVALQNQPVPPPSPAEPTLLLSQPPVDSAAFAVASGHLARRAPHPSAKTASGSLSSPRKPMLETVPPGQMPAREATPVKPATLPAAAPSSPPVVDFNCGRTALHREQTWVTTQELIITRIGAQNGTVPQNLARETRSPLWGEDDNVVALGNPEYFGSKQTAITPRPGATQVARRLGPQFFREANLHPRATWPVG